MIDSPAARRFGYRALPGGGHAFRIRGALTSEGCLVTAVLLVFLYFWGRGLQRLIERARDRGVDWDLAAFLALFLLALAGLWFIVPGVPRPAARLEVSGGRLRVKRLFRWKAYVLDEVLSVERVVVESTGPRGRAAPSAYACRLRMRDGAEIDLGHGRSLEDLDWLGAQLTALSGFVPPRSDR